MPSIAVQYNVINNAVGMPGGIRFANEIGLENSQQILMSASEFTWQTFQQNSTAERRSFQSLTMVVEPSDVFSYKHDNQIYVSSNIIERYSSDLRMELTGVLYHEVARVWQWDDNGQAPNGLITGIADFVRLKSGYVPPHWVQPGQGNWWDDGYDTTARFLDYYNDLRNGFVADLTEG
ncbi:hypothetical protein NE237_023955 [Protea cynaroides]|uniref:Uncharacterized protein n=1 Tax=Protea cynaroides TaxID=273540 RepID=A0A9Q0HEY6_9MAGN|nr:hypothetical protein NE237_023955 [Protea cynaroides]